MAAYEQAKAGAFKKLADDPDTQSRLKELSRRASTGIETGMEELERSQKQSQVGAQTSANLRSMAASRAASGVKGATAASKTAGVLAGGMNQMATFEGDLAARDLAAKQAASEKKSQMVADVTQFDIGQDKAKLEFDEAQRRHKEELQDAETSAKIATGEEVVSGGAVTKTKEAFAGWGIKGDASSGAVKTATKLNIQPLDRSDPNYEVRMSAGTPYFAMSNGRFMNKQGNFLD